MLLLHGPPSHILPGVDLAAPDHLGVTLVIPSSYPTLSGEESPDSWS